MPFLLIGGHALNVHGISRQPGDINLVVPRANQGDWLALMQKLRYSVVQVDDRFGRFRPDSIAAWPIDLMLVDDKTFAKLQAASLPTELGAVTIPVVSARHLATLKIHALKHFHEHRFAKDYGDLVALLRSGKTGLSRSEIEMLCERYATRELFERLTKDVSL
jgi:hypothetical protein